MLAGNVAHAAEPPGPAPRAEDGKQAVAVPVAIADSEIIPRAEQTLRSLQEIRSQVVIDRTLTSLEKDFLAFSEASDRHREDALPTVHSTSPLLCWTTVDEFFLTRSALTGSIDKAFKDLGIQIPFPQQDVHLHWPAKA